MLKIFEALFVLAVEDEEGDIVESVDIALEPALAGAVLAELVLLDRIKLADHRLTVSDQTLTEDTILDKTLFDIQDTTKPRKPKYWVNTLTYKKFLEEIGHQLVEKGVLIRRKKSLVLTIPNTEDPAGHVSAKYLLKNRLREIILAGQPAEPVEAVLLAILYRSGLLKLVFTLGERKAAYKQIKKMISNEADGTALSETLYEIIDAACLPDG